jgi:hypothetical protein
VKDIGTFQEVAPISLDLSQSSSGELKSFDPLLASLDLPYSIDVAPLGFPVRISTNNTGVLAAAESSWGFAPPRFDVPLTDFRVLVSEDGGSVPLSPPKYRAQRNLMIAVSDAENFGACELAGQFGFAFISKGLLEDADFFRYHFLEGLIYSLLDTRYLATIHSACVSWQNRGVLLIGESGAGKSSFAYACTRRGWAYTSDDATSLLLNGAGRNVLGNPNGFRFRPSIALLFPELRGLVRDRNGKPTLEIKTAQLPHVITTKETVVDFVLFLNRQTEGGPNGPHFRAVSQSERFRRLCQSPWPTELSTRERRRFALARLSEADAYELTYQDLDDAIASVENLVAGKASYV